MPTRKLLLTDMMLIMPCVLCLHPDPDELSLARRVGGAENLARLRKVKARVDPTNVFKSHALRGLAA